MLKADSSQIYKLLLSIFFKRTLQYGGEQWSQTNEQGYFFFLLRTGNWTTEPSKGAQFRKLRDVCTMRSLAIGPRVMGRVCASFTSASHI